MSENKTNAITIEDVTKQQINIVLIALVCAIISAIICAIIKFNISIIIGLFAGCIVSIIFHFWMYKNLKYAIGLEKQDAVNYVNVHSAIRKVLYLVVIIALVANPIYKINALGIVITLLEFRLIIYGYNLYVSKK